MLIFKKLTEASDIFNPDNYRDDEYNHKKDSRIRSLHAAMDQLDRAAGIARAQGNLEKATEFEKRIKDFEDLINGLEVSSDDSENSENSSENSKNNKTISGTEKKSKDSGEESEEETNQNNKSAPDKKNKSNEQPNRGEITNKYSGGDPSEDGGGGSGVLNPFEQDPNAKPGGGKEKSKDPTIQDIINILKKLSGDAHKGAVAGLEDIIKNRGVDSDLSESLKSIPAGKTLMDLTDDEFDSLYNNALDEVDKITPVPFEDENIKKSRVKKINDWVADPEAVKELERENNINKQKDNQAIKARDREKDKYKNFKSIDKFKFNFWNTINDQVTKDEEDIDTPTRINRQYEGETGVVKNGTRKEEINELDKPSIDFYFDMSGSWTDDKKAIEMGKSIVKTVQDFEDQGELTLNVYYFSDIITTSMDDSRLGLGTWAWEKILENIKANNSKNVVLMTDSDMEDQAENGSTCLVDGYVWIIWRHGQSAPSIPKHLIGKCGNSQYSF